MRCQIFKEALIAKRAADEAAARDAEAKIERGRRVDAITRKFEAMIGEVVETVSSASTELEASAADVDRHGAARAGARDRGCRGVRGSLHQRPGGGIGLGGTVLVHHRDQPPGAGFGARWRRKPVEQAARTNAPRQRIVAGGRAASATSSS